MSTYQMYINLQSIQTNFPACRHPSLTAVVLQEEDEGLQWLEDGNAFLKDQLLAGMIWWVRRRFAAPQAEMCPIP